MNTHPEDANGVTFETVKQLYRDRDYGSMERACRSILERDPNNRDAKFYLGLSAWQSKKLPAAERAFRELVDRNPKDYDAEYSLGVTLMDLGRLDEAEATIHHLATINPSEMAKTKLAEIRAKIATANPTYTSKSDTRQKPQPNPASNEETVAKRLAAGRIEPGRLTGEFRRLPKSYLGKFLFAGATAAAGFGLMVSASPVNELARRASYVPDAERRLADAVTRGLPPHIIEMAQAGLEKAQTMESAIRWVAGLIVVLLLLSALLLLLTGLIGPSMTRYRFYERRIDLTSGVFLRRSAVVWIYQITKVTTEAPLTFGLVGAATLVLLTDAEKFKLVGLDAKKAEQLGEWLSRASQIQRYSVKNYFL